MTKFQKVSLVISRVLLVIDIVFLAHFVVEAVALGPAMWYCENGADMITNMIEGIIISIVCVVCSVQNVKAIKRA